MIRVALIQIFFSIQGFGQMDFNSSTVSELRVAFPPVQVSETSDLPDELFAGSGM